MDLQDKRLYCTNHAAFVSDKGPWPKDLIQDLCSRRGLEYKDGYEERVLERIVAEAKVDEAGRRIVLEGGQYDEYAKKPLFLWMHDENESIGYSLRERVDGNVLKSLVLFLPTENPKCETYFQMAKSGAIKASSICIKPIEVEKTEEAIVFKTWALEAVSICTLWVTTKDFGEIYYNDLITKHKIGEAKDIWFAVFTRESGSEPPHFHVMEGEAKRLASVNIETGEIFRGEKELGARRRALTNAWFAEKQGHARERWIATRPG